MAYKAVNDGIPIVSSHADERNAIGVIITTALLSLPLANFLFERAFAILCLRTNWYIREKLQTTNSHFENAHDLRC